MKNSCSRCGKQKALRRCVLQNNAEICNLCCVGFRDKKCDCPYVSSVWDDPYELEITKVPVEVQCFGISTAKLQTDSEAQAVIAHALAEQQIESEASRAQAERERAAVESAEASRLLLLSAEVHFRKYKAEAKRQVEALANRQQIETETSMAQIKADTSKTQKEQKPQGIIKQVEKLTLQEMSDWIQNEGGTLKEVPVGQKSPYDGIFKKVGEELAAQDIGKSSYVVHKICDLDRRPIEGEKVIVQYNEAGKGTVKVEPQIRKSRSGRAD